jgi:hypothetical protein
MKPKDNPKYLNELYPDVVFALETTSLMDSLTRRLGLQAEVLEAAGVTSIFVQFEQDYIVEISPLSVPEGQSSSWFMDRLRAGRVLTKTDMLAVICTVRRNGNQEPIFKAFALEAESSAVMLAKVSAWILKMSKIRIQPLHEFGEEETDND